MQLIPRERAAHWYRAVEDRIEPVYEVPRADGNGMRSTTLADARKTGLLWSVTRVCNCVSKPGLEVWKLEQAILSALTLPRKSDEKDDAFAHRVVQDMNEQSLQAREFGSLLHQQIEQDLSSKLEVPDWKCEAHLAAVRSWMKENLTDIHASEIIVGDPSLGVAGKLDLDCTAKDFGRCIVDFKCRRFKKGIAPLYPEDSCQLAAYRHCRQLDLFRDGESSDEGPYQPMRLLSLVIDSNPDSPQVFAHWWPDSVDYFSLFIGLLNYLCFSEGYDPRRFDN